MRLLNLILTGWMVLSNLACRETVRTARPPRLPDPPAGPASAHVPLLNFERFGLLFVIPAARHYYVQLSEKVQQEPAELEKEKIRLQKFVPPVVMTHAPSRPLLPEARDRVYALMRDGEAVCQGQLAEPVLLGQLIPNGGEWDGWEVDPWSDPKPPLAEAEKKMPLGELWSQSGVVTAGALPQCPPVRKKENQFLWARPLHLPPPHLLPRNPQGLLDQFESQAKKNLLDGGFYNKIKEFENDMGEEMEPTYVFNVYSDGQTTLVEARGSVGESDCGGGGHELWMLWKVTDGRWEELAREDGLRTILLIGDLNADGLIEVVIGDGGYAFGLTLYQIEGLHLKKVMRSEYPSHEGVC
jgi:hypothetical protein